MTPTPEPREPDDPKIGGVRAGETAIAGGRQEQVEPVKKNSQQREP